jgi:hypothetical protein
MKWLMEPVAVALAVIIVVVAIILFGGFYLKVTHPAPSPTPAPVETALVTEIPTTVPAPETTPATPETTIPTPTPTQPPTYAVAATPIRDPNYYPLPYYSTVYDPRASNLPPVIFQQSYEFNFQYEAVVAKVNRAPLIIDFAVSPGSSSPIRSFFLITVRENSTKKLLAQDGYFRTYSAQSPKRLIFSSPGTYHINMYGSFVNVVLTLRAHQ